MTWVKVDDQFHNHPKVALLGDMQLPALGLHLLALCWSNNYLTDGFIPTGEVSKLCGDLTFLMPGGTPWPITAALTEAGLWEKLEDGWQIHDYLDYQPSKYEVMKQRERVSRERSKAGSKGAAKREANRKQNGSKPLSNQVSKPYAPGPYPIPSFIDQERTRTTTTSLDNGARAETVVHLPLLRAFEQSFGRMLSPMEIESIRHLEDEHPRERIDYALREAADLGKRVVRYVQRVCESQETRGDDRGERQNLGKNANGIASPGDAAAAALGLYGTVPEYVADYWAGRELPGEGLREVDAPHDPPGLASGE